MAESHRGMVSGAAVTPPGQKPQDLDRRFDQTQLREGHHGHMVHRDYAAHFFRWGFVVKFVRTQEKLRILDVGCGQDVPMIRVLTHKMTTLPGAYVGVDLNRIPKKSNIAWVEGMYDEFNFIDRWKEIRDAHEPFDVITNFEVIEHMHPEDGLKLLKRFRRLLAPGGRIYLSTPLNGLGSSAERKQAANHLHEYARDELQGLIEKAGLQVDGRWGTFGAINELKREMTDEEKELCEELHEFYDWEVLCCFLAPKYPDASRNNVWMLSKAPEPDMPVS